MSLASRPSRADQRAIEKRRRELVDEKQTFDARKVESFQNELNRQQSRQFYQDFNKRMDAAPPAPPPIQYRDTLSQSRLMDGPQLNAVAPSENDPARAPKMIADTTPRNADLSKPAAPEGPSPAIGMGAGGPENPTITAEQVRAEIARRKAAATPATAPQGITADQVKAEIARRKAASPAPISPLVPGAKPQPRTDLQGYKGNQFPTNWPKGSNFAAPPTPPPGFRWDDAGSSYTLNQIGPYMAPAQLRQMRADQEAAAAAEAQRSADQRESDVAFGMLDGLPLRVQDDGTSAPEPQRDLGVRATVNALNTAVPGTINTSLDMIEAAASASPGNAAMRAYAEAQNKQEPPRITFGGENAAQPQQQDMRFRAPELPLRAPEDAAQAGADIIGDVAGYMATPGKLTEAGLKATGVTNALMKFAPKGSSTAAKLGRYGARVANPVDDVAHAAAFGAVTAEDGQRGEAALQYGTDPINYLGRPIASLLQRGTIALSTLGKRATPEAIELERVMSLLKAPNPTPAQVQEAAQIIDRLSPPAPKPSRAKRGGPELAAARESAPTPRLDETRPYSAPPEPSGPGIVRRNMDRIVGGGVGAVVGGVGDAYAAEGDGNGDGGPLNATTGAMLGIFGPRALASAGSRGFRAAARAARSPGARAAFDERVAARAVRKGLVSGGLKTEQEALAAARARFGDKPAAVADLTQDSVGTATGLSRLPGATGEAARARGEDLLENRTGRLFSDVEDTTKISPSTVSEDIDAAIKEASDEIGPEYRKLYRTHPTLDSERLTELKADTFVRGYLKAAERQAKSRATTAGLPYSDAHVWDLTKRGMDRAISKAFAGGGKPSEALLDARDAVRAELDNLMGEYQALRDAADAPRMKSARAQGAKVMGGGLSVEKVSALASSLTGRPLTAMQMGAVERLVLDIEKGRKIDGLASERMRKILSSVFDQDTADALVARVRSDVAIVKNSQRINPNVGSPTSQAMMGGGEGPLAAAAGALRAVRSPVETALAAMSKSGSYTKAQRDLMGEMLLEGPSPENLARIYRGKTRGGAPARTPPAPNTGLGSSTRELPGQTSKASPTVAGALVGGGLGYVGSDGDPTATLAGAVGLGGIGALAGKAAKGGKAPRKPAPAPKPPAMAEAGPKAPPAPPVKVRGGSGAALLSGKKPAPATPHPAVHSEPFTSNAGDGVMHYEERPFWWADDSLDISMDFVPTRELALREVKDLFSKMYDRVLAHAATERRSVYSANGFSPAHKRLYAQALKTMPAPEGYTVMTRPDSDTIYFLRNDIAANLPEGAPRNLSPVQSAAPKAPPASPTVKPSGAPKPPRRPN